MSTPYKPDKFVPSKFTLVLKLPGGAEVRIPVQTTGMPEITGDVVLEADNVGIGSTSRHPDLDKRKN